MIVEGRKKRQTEQSLNNWVNDLVIYCDRKDWGKRKFIGECQDFCFGNGKYEVPADIKLKMLRRLWNVSLEHVGKIWV